MADPPRIRPPVVPLPRPRDPDLGKIPAPRDGPSQLAVLAAEPLIEHVFVSNKEDGDDSLLVQPSDWNDAHKMTLPASSVIARDPTGSGPAQLFILDSLNPEPDELHIPTTEFVWKMVNDRVNEALTGGGMCVTGDIIASTQHTRIGWWPLDGKSIGRLGSGADRADDSNHLLFIQFWDNMYGVSWPINGGRGASAEADWIAGKTINLPNSYGRALVGADYANGITPEIPAVGSTGGVHEVRLTEVQMPGHSHNILPAGTFMGQSSGLGGAGVGVLMNQYGVAPSTGFTGADGTHNDGWPHTNVQPSLGVFWHIKI